MLDTDFLPGNSAQFVLSKLRKTQMHVGQLLTPKVDSSHCFYFWEGEGQSIKTKSNSKFTYKYFLMYSSICFAFPCVGAFLRTSTSQDISSYLSARPLFSGWFFCQLTSQPSTRTIRLLCSLSVSFSMLQSHFSAYLSLNYMPSTSYRNRIWNVALQFPPSLWQGLHKCQQSRHRLLR